MKKWIFLLQFLSGFISSSTAQSVEDGNVEYIMHTIPLNKTYTATANRQSLFYNKQATPVYK